MIYNYIDYILKFFPEVVNVFVISLVKLKFLYNNINDRYKLGKTSDMYTDLSKAFDSVHHQQLLKNFPDRFDMV